MIAQLALYTNVYYFTASATFTVPYDWRSDANMVICVGNGGNGAYYYNAGSSYYLALSGAGGAYAHSLNTALVPNQSVTISVPAITGGGSNPSTYGDVFFGGTSLANCTVGAQSGQSGDPLGWVTAVGGSAAASVGQVKYSGGNGSQSGGSNIYFAAGGGAGGPNGAGGTGLFGYGTQTTATGGASDGGVVAGGAYNAPGNSGVEFGASYGCGSGAGAYHYGAYQGGLYGGGGSAECDYHQTQWGSYGPGLVIVAYSPLIPAAMMTGL
jgi:hypothetical protein